jgi:hypothetical protein
MVLSRLLGRGVGATSRRGAANKGKNRLAGDLDDDVVKETKSDVAQMKKAMSARIDEAEDTKRGAALRRQSVQEAGGRAMLRTGSRAGAVGVAGAAGYESGRGMMEDEEEDTGSRRRFEGKVTTRAADKEEEKPKPSKTEDKKMSFKEAFATARKDGDKTFTWEGKRYTTEMAKPSSAKAMEGQHENISDDTRERARKSVEMYKGGAVKKYAKGGVVANCGASMKPQQKWKK